MEHRTGIIIIERLKPRPAEPYPMIINRQRNRMDNKINSPSIPSIRLKALIINTEYTAVNNRFRYHASDIYNSNPSSLIKNKENISWNAALATGEKSKISSEKPKSAMAIYDTIKLNKAGLLISTTQYSETMKDIIITRPAPVGIFLECIFLLSGTSNGPNTLETLRNTKDSKIVKGNIDNRGLNSIMMLCP